MCAQISYDLVMEPDMAFVEGTLRVPPGDWQVFIFSKRDIPDPIVDPQTWSSDVSGICVMFPHSEKLDQEAVEAILCSHFKVPKWTGVRGPDSMQLR